MLGANGIVGGGPPLATGAALAAKLDGKGGVHYLLVEMDHVIRVQFLNQ